MGNQAFAYAALAAGVRVVAGYPGTPSTELVETVAKLKAQGSAEGVHVEWSTNEKAALEVLAGASYAGARCLFTFKQVGLNVASDPLMSLNYVGIKGGLVLFVADDPGPISSQTEQDTRRFAAFAKIPVLDPQNLEQGYAMMQEAFEISERYHTPVIVRPTTRICHASTYLEVPEHTVAHPAGTFEKDPKWVIFPRRSFAAHGEVNERLPQIADAYSSGKAADAFNPIENHGDATPRLVSCRAPRKRRGASSTADTSPRKRRRGARPSQRSCAPFLAYLDAGFLLLALYAVELRVGSTEQVLPGIDAITNPRVADGHPQQIRNLGARELVVDCRAQMQDILLRYRLLKHHELIAAITRDKATRRRADFFERSGYDLKSMVALHMSIAVVNLLKAVGVHHKKIHVFGLIHI